MSESKSFDMLFDAWVRISACKNTFNSFRVIGLHSSDPNVILKPFTSSNPNSSNHCVICFLHIKKGSCLDKVGHFCETCVVSYLEKKEDRIQGRVSIT